MKSEVYKKVEERLYDIYEKIREVENIERECESLKLHSDMIKRDIQNANVEMEADINMGVNYSSIKVQTSNSGGSYIDSELVRAITKLEEEWRYVRKKLLKKGQRIREIERSISYIRGKLDTLDEESRMFINLKYNERRSVVDVADHLSMAKTTAYRKREEILSTVSKWINVS